MCIETYRKDCGFVGLTLRRAWLISSTNSRCSALEHWPYSCIKQRQWSNNFKVNMHSLPTSGIHSSTQLSSRRFKSIPSSLGKLCWVNAGVEEFPTIIHVNSVRITTLSRRDANNIQGISFGFLDQFVLFSWERRDVAGSSCLWQDCHLHVAFKSPRVKALCAVPNHLSRCIAGATWGFQLWIAGGGGNHECFERKPLCKVGRRSLVTRATTDARWVCVILRISW